MADDPVVTVPTDAAFMLRAPRSSFVVVEDDHGVGVVAADRLELPIKTNSVHLTISRELALDYGLVDPTPEEAARRERELAALRIRQATERAQPGPALTLEALLGFLEWPAGYAEHVLHPACHCTPLDHEDPYVCDWGRELGWRHDYERGFHRVDAP